MSNAQNKMSPRDEAYLESQAVIEDIARDLRFHLLASKAAYEQAQKKGDFKAARQCKAQADSLLRAITLLLN
jgi:hypothetical protein